MTGIGDYRTWTPAAQQKALERLRAAANDTWRPFYCTLPACDGNPHGDWTWTHARTDQHPPPGDWNTWLTIAGRGAGKAVCCSTPMPVPLTGTLGTPTGWKAMGDIAVGDLLYDEDGNPTTVTAVYDVQPERAWRLHFSDGTWIDACADHQWVTLDLLDRKRIKRDRPPGGAEPRIPAGWAAKPPITTAGLVATLTYGPRGDRNHCIPLAAPLRAPQQTLPVDPWMLGYWLGNGDLRSGTVTTHNDDEAHVRERAAAAGHPCGDRYAYERAATFTPRGLRAGLRTIGVLGEKHIPAQYLRASVEQRRQLLAGLLDSDGHIDPEKQNIEFRSEDEALALGVAELARSLGQKPVVKKSAAKLYGMEKSPRYRVTWRSTCNPFLSPRKAQAWRPPAGQGLRSQHRMIVSAEPVAPRPMRCVTVDSPNSMYLAGEGMIPTHNTRLGSEYTHRVVEQVPRIIIVAPTSADIRDVIVDGESGILATARPGRRPQFEPTKRRLTWPNGAQALLISAEEPERLRGPQSHWAWCDELATYPKPEDLWSNLVLGLRLGKRPRSLVTTTPKPVPLLKRLIADPRNTVTRATTYDNVANLAPSFTEEIVKQYEGTRVGRQELYAEMLTDVEGALWTWELIETSRDPGPPEQFDRIIVAIDPAGTSNRRSDETGIIVAGILGDTIHILADRSGKYTPNGWAQEAGRLYEAWAADAIVPEVNYGADMVAHTLRSSGIRARITPVVATRGKQVRAEPVVALYEQGRCRLAGSFPKLEAEMAEWVPGRGASPNRVDAMVWAVTALDRRTAKAHIATHRHLRAV